MCFFPLFFKKYTKSFEKLLLTYAIGGVAHSYYFFINMLIVDIYFKPSFTNSKLKEFIFNRSSEKFWFYTKSQIFIALMPLDLSSKTKSKETKNQMSEKKVEELPCYPPLFENITFSASFG